MTKRFYLLLTIFVLVVVPSMPLHAQELVKPEIVPQTERYEFTVSTASSKNVALSNMAMTRFGDQTGQTQSASITNSGYVFPSAKQRFNRYVKGTIGPFSLFGVQLQQDCISGTIVRRNGVREWKATENALPPLLVQTLSGKLLHMECQKHSTSTPASGKAHIPSSGRVSAMRSFRTSRRELEVVNAFCLRRSLSVLMPAPSSRMRPGIHRDTATRTACAVAVIPC